MNISELIEQLQAVLEDEGDLDVRIAMQPSWPLAANVAAVVTDKAARANDEDAMPNDEDARNVVWIAASSSVGYSENPYAPRGAWAEASW